MNRRQARALYSVDHVLAFLKQPRFAVPRIAALRAELEAAEKRLRALGSAQLGALTSRGADGRESAALRRELRLKHLLPIARRGKLLLRGLPGIDESLRVPHARARDDELLAAATRIADAVRPHAKAFTQAKFPKTFITQLERAALALEQATKRSETGINRASRLTAELREAVSHARQIVATLDSLVTAEFYDDKATLALWKRAKRIPAQFGRPLKGKRARATD